VIPVILLYAFLVVSVVIASSGKEPNYAVLIIGLGMVLLMFWVCVYLGIAWLFMYHLIIDQRFKFWDAMEVSRRVAGRQFWRLLGFSIVLYLIGGLGVLCCYVGVLFVMPLIIAAIAYAYEDLFGGLPQEMEMIEIN
jgi:uncharacterized membrane protein